MLKNNVIGKIESLLAYKSDHHIAVSRRQGMGPVERVGNVKNLIAQILLHDPAGKSDRINGAYEEVGTELLAWYQSYHVHGDDWGIFFDVEKMSQFISLNSFGEDPSIVLQILFHERYHFLVEYLCASISYGEAVGHQYPDSKIGNSIYEVFRKAKHLKGQGHGGFFEIDEAMANAYSLIQNYKSSAFTPSITPAQLQKQLCSLCDLGGPGYQDYPKVSAGNLLSVRSQTKAPSEKVFVNSFATLRWHLTSPANLGFQDFALGPYLNGSGLLAKRMLLPKAILERVPIYLVFPNPRAKSGNLLHLRTQRAPIKVDVSDKFQKSLNKLAKKQGWIRSAWNLVVHQLAAQTYNPQFLKQWPQGGKDIWSIRVSNNRSPAYRAHLLKQASGQPWLAVEIGDHKKMGHG
jgi:hypothetical protein